MCVGGGKTPHVNTSPRTEGVECPRCPVREEEVGFLRKRSERGNNGIRSFLFRLMDKLYFSFTFCIPLVCVNSSGVSRRRHTHTHPPLHHRLCRLTNSPLLEYIEGDICTNPPPPGRDMFHEATYGLKLLVTQFGFLPCCWFFLINVYRF